jgi:hypothetical protein
MSLQEKFQITVPPTEEPTEHQWASFESARKTGEAGFIHSNNVNASADVTTKTNYMPPGMEIHNQKRVRIDPMVLSMAGATDVSKDTNPEAFAEGFTRKDMAGTDDQYTGEHMDHFYGEVVDENGKVGFVERNNYLDRE